MLRYTKVFCAPLCALVILAASAIVLCGVSTIHAASGPLFGITGGGFPIINGNGYQLSGTHLSNVSLSGDEQTDFTSYSSVLTATTSALDPATHKMYVQRIHDNTPYLVALNATSMEQVDVFPGMREVPLPKLFRYFFFESKTNSLVGHAGPGALGFGQHGFIFSGTEVVSYDLASNSMQTLISDSNTYVAMATAYDSYTQKIYLQQIKSDGVYLTTMDVRKKKVTTATNRLDYAYRFLVFDSVDRVLFGLTGSFGQYEFMGQYGFMVLGSYFAALDPATGNEVQLSDETGTFIASTATFDPASQRLFAQRIYNDGVHLVSINTKTGVLDDRGLLTAPFQIFCLDNPPPSELTLAKISQATYQYCASGSVPPDIDGFSYVVTSGANGAGAFCARVYRNAKQVVVAFRGTETKDNFSQVKNLVADNSFVTGVVNSGLLSYAFQASGLLLNILGRDDFGGVNITLTGHSLGGAIAQIVGQKTGLPTLAFDSPGPGTLLDDPNLIEVLSILDVDFGNAGPIRSIRLYGDQVSLIGEAVSGSTVLTLDTDPDLLPYVNDWSCALKNHSIEMVVLQLQKGAALTLGLAGQGRNEALIFAVSSSLRLATFFFQVDPTVNYYGIDPAPSFEYTFLGEVGSPLISSVKFPLVPGVHAYTASELTGNGWAQNSTVQPLEGLSVQPTRGVKFWALDDFGRPMVMPDDFVFDVSFASAGAFSGTLSGRPNSEACPSCILHFLLD